MSMDLTQMTLAQLTKLKARVEKAIERAEGRKKKDALAAMEKRRASLGLAFLMCSAARTLPQRKSVDPHLGRSARRLLKRVQRNSPIRQTPRKPGPAKAVSLLGTKRLLLAVQAQNR